MKVYETTIILKQTADLLTVEKEILDKIEQLVQKFNGTMISVDKWGVRKLSYMIQKQEEGYYILLNFNADQTLVKELDRILRINESVLRAMTIRIDPKPFRKPRILPEASRSNESGGNHQEGFTA